MRCGGTERKTESKLKQSYWGVENQGNGVVCGQIGKLFRMFGVKQSSILSPFPLYFSCVLEIGVYRC